jgi:hypothetical protein|tara:strand:+ start:799 stop:1044 length:246 start_codon:yes stop_codon:yes gene_type:complete
MIYGSSSWSETPTSTLKIQESNGEELDNNLLIDTKFSVNLPLQVDKDVDLFLSQDEDFSVNISRELDFVVNINSDQTWSLS